MAKVVVTAADLDRAARLRAFLSEPGATVKELASLLAEIREEALLCAIVRVERQFDVVRRKQPGLPFGDV